MMRGCAAALGLVAALGGCAREPVAPPAETAAPASTPAATPTAAPAPAPTPSASPATPVVSLEGQWKVAAIDGADFDESYGLALEGDAQAIWWNPRCAGAVVPYRIDGIVFFPEASSGASPAPVCAIAVPARLGEVLRALRSATRIERTASNGVLLSGGGHSLLLFSQ